MCTCPCPGRSRTVALGRALRSLRFGDEDPESSCQTQRKHATVGFGNLLTQTEPGFASQVGFDEGPVLGISDRDITRNRQVVSGLFRISQGGE